MTISNPTDEEAREERYSRDEQRDDMRHNGTSADQLRAQATYRANEVTSLQNDLRIMEGRLRSAGKFVMRRLDSLLEHLEPLTSDQCGIDLGRRLARNSVKAARDDIRREFTDAIAGPPR